MYYKVIKNIFISDYHCDLYDEKLNIKIDVTNADLDESIAFIEKVVTFPYVLMQKKLLSDSTAPKKFWRHFLLLFGTDNNYSLADFKVDSLNFSLILSLLKEKTGKVKMYMTTTDENLSKKLGTQKISLCWTVHKNRKWIVLDLMWNNISRVLPRKSDRLSKTIFRDRYAKVPKRREEIILRRHLRRKRGDEKDGASLQELNFSQYSHVSSALGSIFGDYKDRKSSLLMSFAADAKTDAILWYKERSALLLCRQYNGIKSLFFIYKRRRTLYCVVIPNRFGKVEFLENSKRQVLIGINKWINSVPVYVSQHGGAK